jgi:hypothetical protein
MNLLRIQFLLPLVAAVALLSAPSAKAINLTFANGGGDTQSFSTSISVIGGSIPVSVSASGNFTFSTSVPLFGTLSVSGGVNIPNQTVNLVLNGGSPIAVNTTPSGSALLSLWNEQTGGFDPGGDGSNPLPASLPSHLNKADLTGLNVQFLGGTSVPLSSNTINVNASGNIDTIVGDISLGGTLVGSASGSVNNLNYVQTGGTGGNNDGLAGNGFPVRSPSDPNQSVGYFSAQEGTISGNLDATMSADLIFDVLGLFDIPFDLGDVLDFGTSINETDFPLPGDIDLNDLNPTGYTPPGDDLKSILSLNLAFPLPFAFSESGSEPLTYDTDVNLLGLTWDLNLTGSANFSVNATIVINGLTYNLEDTTPGVVAPEPSSVWLLALAGIGFVPLYLRRRRK